MIDTRQEAVVINPGDLDDFHSFFLKVAVFSNSVAAASWMFQPEQFLLSPQTKSL